MLRRTKLAAVAGGATAAVAGWQEPVAVPAGVNAGDCCGRSGVRASDTTRR
jgi:hypothetical protein